MIYAIKLVDGKEVNKKICDWNTCRTMVLGHDSLYKGCMTEEEADLFLASEVFNKEAKSEGYAPVSMDTHLIYAKYLFHRFRSDYYDIAVYKTAKGRVTCKGYHLPDNDRLMYAMGGKYEKVPKYGYQFIVSSYKEHITDTKESIVSYLSCGIIKGIGPKRAEAIYKEFGPTTMEVLDKSPERLLKIKGISRKGLQEIKRSYNESKGSRPIVSYLLSFGLSQKYGMKLYKQYGIHALHRVKENPYILCLQHGITFLDADRIAKAEGFPMESDIRFWHGAVHVLKKNQETGSTGMELQKFGQALYYLLGTEIYTKEKVSQTTLTLVKEKKLRVIRIEDHQYVFTEQDYFMENRLSQELIGFMSLDKKAAPDISKLLTAEDVALDEKQKTGIINAITYPISAITGGPGTGKTTIIRFIKMVNDTLDSRQSVLCLAPTGRAARRITEETGIQAYTIHSELRMTKDIEPNEEEVVINNTLVIVDEFSMVDTKIASILVHSLGKGCSICFVGDIHQLPSIGPGAVFRDIVESNVIPVTYLEHIYRQGKNSRIYENAKKIRTDRDDLLEGDDFHMTECATMEDVRNVMCEHVISLVKKYGMMNVMCICPFWEYKAGIHDMNMLLQERLNPASPEKKECYFRKHLYRVGDPVMHTQINTEDVSNGDIGMITDILNDDNRMLSITVDINGKKLDYTGEDISLLVLAYAMSVYKAQGSQADAEVFTLMPFHKGMLYYNIPYVAASRGKKEVIFVGSKTALAEAIHNREKEKRITLLGYFLRRNSGQFVRI